VSCEHVILLSFDFASPATVHCNFTGLADLSAALSGLPGQRSLLQAEWSSAHHTSGTCRRSSNFVRTRTRTIQLHHRIRITGPRRIAPKTCAKCIIALLLLRDLRKVPLQLAFVCDKCAVIMDGPDRQSFSRGVTLVLCQEGFTLSDHHDRCFVHARMVVHVVDYRLAIPSYPTKDLSSPSDRGGSLSGHGHCMLCRHKKLLRQKAKS